MVRCWLVLLTSCLSSDLALTLIGLVNKHFLKGRLSTVTLFYFADKRYLESVTFPWYAKRRRWRPVLGGFFLQNGNASHRTGGIICVAGASEDEVSAGINRDRLLKLHQRMTRIGDLLQVKSVSYSGILPSLLAAAGVHRRAIEVERTIQWVVIALSQVKKQCGLAPSTPVVILGSEGFVGSKLVALLKAQDLQEIVCIDARHSDGSMRGPSALAARSVEPVVLVNVTRGQAIEGYVEVLPSGSVVLNEVYPECNDSTLAALRRRGIRYFHIQGVKATAIPRFPRAYAGAVPCCAASAALEGEAAGGRGETVLLREEVIQTKGELHARH